MIVLGHVTDRKVIRSAGIDHEMVSCNLGRASGIESLDRRQLTHQSRADLIDPLHNREIGRRLRLIGQDVIDELLFVGELQRRIDELLVADRARWHGAKPLPQALPAP